MTVRRRKTLKNISVFLTSTIGPKTRNANSDPLVNVRAKASATKASTVEHMDKTTAKVIRVITDTTGPALTVSKADCGTTVCSTDAKAVPIIRYRPISKNSSTAIVTAWGKPWRQVRPT